MISASYPNYQVEQRVDPTSGAIQYLSDTAIATVKPVANGFELSVCQVAASTVPPVSSDPNVLTPLATFPPGAEWYTTTVVQDTLTWEGSSIPGIRTTTRLDDGTVTSTGQYSVMSNGEVYQYFHVSDGQTSLTTRSPHQTDQNTNITTFTQTTEVYRTGATGPPYKESVSSQTFQVFGFGEALVAETEGETGAEGRYLFYYDVPFDLNADPVVRPVPYNGKVQVEIETAGSSLVRWTRYIYNSEGFLVKVYHSRAGAATIPTLAAILATPESECDVENMSVTNGVFADEHTETNVNGVMTQYSEVVERSLVDPATGLHVRESRTRTYSPSGVLLAETATAKFEATDPSADGITLLGETIYSISADGRRTTFSRNEALVEDEYVVTSTSTQGTVDNPWGIPSRSTQRVNVTKSGGSSQSFENVYTGGSAFSQLSSSYTTDETGANGEGIHHTYQDGIEVMTVTESSSTDGAVHTTVEVDAAGVLTTIVSQPNLGLDTQTRAGLAVSDPWGGQIRSATDLITQTTRGPRPVAVAGQPTPVGYALTTTVSDGTTLRTLSVEEYDSQDRKVKETDEAGRSVTWDYAIIPSSGGEMVTETRWGNVTTITESSADGRLVSITGSGVIPEFHSYNFDPTTLREIETIYYGTNNSARWVKQYTDSQGRLVRTERPAPPNDAEISLQWTETYYNGKGQRVRVTSSDAAPQLFEYDALGQLFRQGYDLNGNGKLDIASEEPVTEYSTAYENLAGAWWKVQRTRTYTGPSLDQFRQQESRQRLGFGPLALTESIAPSGARTVSATVVDRPNRTRITTTAITGLSSSEQNFVNDLLIYADAPGGATKRTYTYYDNFDRTAQIKSPEGIVFYSYSPTTGELTEQSVPDHQEILRTTSFTYYPVTGLLATKTAPVSRLYPDDLAQTFYEYDTLGRLMKQWGEGNYPVRYDYDAVYGDRTAMRTYRTVDTTPNVMSAADWNLSTASVTTWTYDPASGALTKKQEGTASAQGVEYRYQPGSNRIANRTWVRTGADGRRIRTHYHYSPTGALLSMDYSDGTPTVSYTYRRDGSIATQTDAAGHTSFSDFDGHGLPESGDVDMASGWLGGLQFKDYRNERGQPVAFEARLNVTDTNGAIRQVAAPKTIFTYNLYGDFSKVDSSGSIVQYSGNYPGTHLMISGGASGGLRSLRFTNAFSGSYSVEYDSSPVSATSPKFRQMRKLSLTTSGRIDSQDPDFLIGGLPVAQRGLGAWTYIQDKRGQILAGTRTWRSEPDTDITLPPVVGYSYDDIGNRKVATSTNAVSNTLATKVTYTTNNLNQYTTLAQGALSGSHSRALIVTGMAPPTQPVNITLKSDLNLATPHTLADNVATTRAGNVFSYRLPISTTSSAAEWLSVSVNSSGGSPINNAQTLGNRYIAPTNQSPTYDADGNLASDARWIYQWDGENRLISMETQQTTAVNVGVPRQKLEFGYDSRSRRIMKRVYSGTGTGANIVWTLQSDARFVYHGWNLMAELEMIPNAADAPRRTLVQAQMPYLRRSYMWGPDMSGTLDGAGGVGGLLAMRRHERGTQSTETFWATHDLNGNIIGLVQLPVTGSQPAKMAVYDYDPSGQLTRVNEPEANFNPIRFSSKYTDSETGLVYYGYRYLSPELGRWLSRDPIGERGGINLYGMVGNDAVNRWDLLGRCEGCGFGGVDLKVPKTGPGNTSIGSRITFLYLMRMLVGDGYASYGRLQSPDDLYTIADRKKEMEKDLGEEFDSFYLAYGSKLQREGKLTSNWQKIRVKNEKVTEYLGGGIIWPSTGKLSAGWWLSSANDISASGSLEYRCRSGIIQYRNRSIVWRWNDRIDCNDYNTLREVKGAGIPGSILEGIIVNSLESLINASFKVIVIGKDERKVSGT